MYKFIEKRSNKSYFLYFNSGGKLSRNHKENLELPLFDLTTIVNATCNFSNDTKLGGGDFGSVFKESSDASRVGCCFQQYEMMLIYACMPNKSWDFFIFGFIDPYGYMSPEYTIDGFYSIKSDVYSYGVLC
ncbi:putative protein kinase RLK-Pelle-DLSV family [Rosa chinensis]|uniref:Non-specific serine/threonine protein kinase n=1 Tax=Rosa chinensis TaxID=74649 RepID=A0A2P6Q8X2_ROSCH|nr:putative protein kinase RLK-Pelle-DLSV family [Rosa chinensis]